MKREFKPGDVAMVRRGPSWSGRALYTLDGWIDQSGDADRQPPLFDVTDVRPLVVIDPEDREQVERLADAVLAEASGYRIDKAILTVGLGKGLREFADPTPPRPEEPLGLGAVVEDAEGQRWIAHEPDPGYASPHRWVRPSFMQASQKRMSYADINAVRVLSPGVTEDGAS